MTMGALAKYTRKRFGVDTHSNDWEVTSVVGVALAAANNPDRLSLILVNLSDTDMYVAPNKNPSTSLGIRLASSGGFISLNADTDGALVGYEWNVYCSAASKVMYALEMEGAE